MKRNRTVRARCERHAAKMREENAGNIRKREAAVRRWATIGRNRSQASHNAPEGGK